MLGDFVGGRRKNKMWIGDDPNNKAWAEDKNRFGYKMLKGMGWKEGSGLGKKQNGRQDYIKITKNFENLGVGAKDADVHMLGAITAKTEIFHDVLRRLQPINNAPPKKDDDDDKSDKEEKSTKKPKKIKKQKKMKRIHLQTTSKRLKAKSINNFSKEEVAAVFGAIPIFQQKTKTEKEQEKQDVKKEEKKDNFKSGTPFEKSKMTTTEYFRQKMKEKLAQLKKNTLSD